MHKNGKQHNGKQHNGKMDTKTIMENKALCIYRKS